MKNFPVSCVALVEDATLMLSAAQGRTMKDYLAKHEGQYVQMSYSQPKKDRSNNQNRYYWSVIIQMIADETGDSPESTHEAMKNDYLPRRFTKFRGREIPEEKTTTVLSTVEFEDFLERCRAFAAAELNLVIPMPNESLDPTSLPQQEYTYSN